MELPIEKYKYEVKLTEDVYCAWTGPLKSIERGPSYSSTVTLLDGSQYTGSVTVSHQRDVLCVGDTLLFDDGRVLHGKFTKYIYSKEYLCEYKEDSVLLTLGHRTFEISFECLIETITKVSRRRCVIDDFNRECVVIVSPTEIVLIHIKNKQKKFIMSTSTEEPFVWSPRRSGCADFHVTFTPKGLVHIYRTIVDDLRIESIDGNVIADIPYKASRHNEGIMSTHPTDYGFEAYSIGPMVRHLIATAYFPDPPGPDFSFAINSMPTDLEIVCPDGVVCGHKLVMAAFSEPIRHSCINENFSTDGIIHADPSTKIVTLALQLIYGVTVDPLTCEEIVDLITLADQWLCPYLYHRAAAHITARRAFVEYAMSVPQCGTLELLLNHLCS